MLNIIWLNFLLSLANILQVLTFQQNIFFYLSIRESYCYFWFLLLTAINNVSRVKESQYISNLTIFLGGPEGSERKNFRIETQSTIFQPNKEQLLTLAIDQH